MKHTYFSGHLAKLTRSTLLLSVLLVGGNGVVLGQFGSSTISTQSFDVANSNTDTQLGYSGTPTLRTGSTTSGDAPVGTFYTSANNAWTISNSTQTVFFRGRAFSPGATSKRIRFRLAAFSIGATRGGGPNTGDLVRVFVSVNSSSTYDEILAVTGRAGGTWYYDAGDFSTTRISTTTYPNPSTFQARASNGGDFTGEGLSVMQINLPASVQQVRFYIVANTNSASALWAIDDVEVSSSAPLPVELKSFTADATAKGTRVRWTTASEKDNAGFEVQRGTSPEQFATVARVAGHGSTTQAHSYEWMDAQPLAGLSYYRLRQLDKDGTESFSPAVAVRSEGGTKAVFFPNPTTGRVVLAAGLGTTHYRILNTLGQAVLAGDAAGGSTIDVQALRPGSYFLELQTATGRQVQHFQREL